MARRPKLIDVAPMGNAYTLVRRYSLNSKGFDRSLAKAVRAKKLSPKRAWQLQQMGIEKTNKLAKLRKNLDSPW